MGLIATIVLSLILALVTWLFRGLILRLLRKPQLPPGARLPPIPLATSFWGHVEVQTLDFFKKKAIEWTQLYGPVYRLKLRGFDIVVANDFNSIKKFLSTKELLNRSRCFGVRREHFEGLGSLNGELWNYNKNFCMNMLRDLGFARTAMEDKMMEEFGYLEKKIGKTNGKPISVKDYIQPCATNNIASFFYARHLAPDHPSRHQLQKLFINLCVPLQSGPMQVFCPRIVRWVIDRLPFTRFGRINACMTALEKFTEAQILQYKAETSTDVRHDFIHGYMKKIEDAKRDRNAMFTHRYLVGNVNAFILGGTVSTTMTMWWLLLLCSQHPDTIQATIQREVDEVVGPERRPTWDDRKQMPYTLACVWEVERWKTASPLGAARESSDDVVIDGYFIPKGTTVLYNLWAVHNDPNLWPEPHKFNPHRFLNADGSIVKLKPEHFIPFGIGRRSCPGEMFAVMEIFLMVTFLLQKYDVALENAIDCDLNNPELILPQQVPVKLRFLQRHSSNAESRLTGTR